jgi:hypothetical protein
VLKTVLITHSVVMVPYNFGETVKDLMDCRLDSAEADLAVSDVLGRMKLFRELHRLHISKEASNAECDSIN